MAYVITESCTDVCDTACVEVCPVDCIHGPLPVEEMRKLPPGSRAGLRMYIEPDECIGCGACAPECPVSAILDESENAAARQVNAAFYGKR